MHTVTMVHRDVMLAANLCSSAALPFTVRSAVLTAHSVKELTDAPPWTILSVTNKWASRVVAARSRVALGVTADINLYKLSISTLINKHCRENSLQCLLTHFSTRDEIEREREFESARERE
jgi:hypothetical protein